MANITGARACAPSSPKRPEWRASEAIDEALEAIGVAEKRPELCYLGIPKNIEAGTVFKKDKKVVGKRRNCGYLGEGGEVPQPFAHLQGQAEGPAENW